MAGELLELIGISKEFPGVKALDAVTIRVRAASVHALMGENGAGKSTLLKCLFGIYAKDSGDIRIDGRSVDIRSPKDALDLGIAMIHQEPSPVKDRSVAENFWLGRMPVQRCGPLAWVDQRKMEAETARWLAEFGIEATPDTLLRELSVSQIQFLEIARAVSLNARVIIMDEPTSSLTATEVERLFVIMQRLLERGVAVIYISHKMDEILRIADDVSIMRDGKLVGTWPAKELTTSLIVSRMVGRELSQRFPTRQTKPGEVVLSLCGVSSPRPHGLRDVSLELRRGEILGLGGLVGSRRTEVLEVLFGLRRPSKGHVMIKGRKVDIRSPRDAIAHGLAFLTEDRRATGIIPLRSLVENATLVGMERYVRWGFYLDEPRQKADCERYIRELRIKTPSSATEIRNLSGGNQQKVLLARWLLTGPEILLLDEPTRGIDIGAKHEIYNLIGMLADQGKSIIMISSEMPELLGLADRIAVMCEGRLSGVLDAGEASEPAIMSLSTQFRPATMPQDAPLRKELNS
jgi:methyl-galactoside transport system ATP-binding protein